MTKANVKRGKEAFDKEIEIQLDEEAKDEQRRKLVDINNRLLAKEGEKSASSSGFNAELKAIRKERETCLGAINSGCLTEKVKVREYMHIESGQVEIRREDNNEVVGTRDMTAEERQTEMFAGHDGAKANGKSDGSSATVGDLAAARAKKKSSKKASKKASKKGEEQPEA